VRPRPPQNRSQAFEGVHPLMPFASGSQKFQPLPDPLGPPPYHYDLKSAVPDIDQRAKNGLIFHMMGDTGGIKTPDKQMAVAAAMKGDLIDAAHAPAFFYHLGDVIYYNGQISEYYSQFYEPYDHYTPPIISIPGNHDGDPINAQQKSLDGWVRYFMTSAPHINPESHDAPRATMSLPNVYFTLLCPFVTIVGMYTNVPEHGSIDSIQQQWLTHELATADPNKALIVAMHHPIYSFDNHHGGSPRMADALQQAINDSRRVPNLVAAAHVHNYQRVERTLVKGSTTPFLVVGTGGYYHLHSLNIDKTARGPITDPITQATLVAHDDTSHGYATITVDSDHISGVITLVAEGKQAANKQFDKFQYSAKALKLPDGVTISL
jgi:hypothetical protein